MWEYIVSLVEKADTLIFRWKSRHVEKADTSILNFFVFSQSEPDDFPVPVEFQLK